MRVALINVQSNWSAFLIDRAKITSKEAEAFLRRPSFPEMPKWQRAMEEMFGDLAAEKTTGARPEANFENGGLPEESIARKQSEDK